MFTIHDLLAAAVVPLLISAALLGVGKWRNWPWMPPLAIGGGFLAGYALLGFPKLPPRDGTDWLFWLTIPLTGLGLATSALWPGRIWPLAISTSLVSLVILHPIVPRGLSLPAWCAVGAILLPAGWLQGWIVRVSTPRVGPRTMACSLAMITFGAAVLIASSHLRIVGVYGLTATSAFIPACILISSPRSIAGLATLLLPLLSGMLLAGHFYADPGVPWLPLLVLLTAPALFLLPAMLPASPSWRQLACFILIAAAVAAAMLPAAIAAKRASESNLDVPL